MDKIKKPNSHGETIEQADPTKFSRYVLPTEEFEQGPPNKKGRETKTNSLGERFHHIPETEHGLTQQFISRILKPFVNVADVVAIDDKMYSYESNIENITQNTPKEEMIATIKIINFVFQDNDRSIMDMDHNIKYNSGKYTLFDFAEPFGGFWHVSAYSEMHDLQGWLEFQSPAVKIAIRQKLTQMSSYFHGEQGKEQVGAAFKATGKTIDELFLPLSEDNLDLGEEKRDHSFDDFYKQLVVRVDVMNRIVCSDAPVSMEDGYKGRKVIVEIGGQLQGVKADTSLLNELSIPRSEHPLYIGIDQNKGAMGRVPLEHALSSAIMVADIENLAFLDNKELDGHVDRLFMFNVLSDYNGDFPLDKEYLSKLINKIATMLKPGGKAFIGEWYKPQKLQDITELPLPRELTSEILKDTDVVQKHLRQEGISERKIKEILHFFDMVNQETGGAHCFIFELHKRL